MPAQPISLWRTGLYWTLALAVAGTPVAGSAAQNKAKAAKAKPKTALATTEHDPLTEWELVNGAAIELREKIAKQPRNEALRQQMSDLAVRSAVGAERALAIGDASLFDSFRGSSRSCSTTPAGVSAAWPRRAVAWPNTPRECLQCTDFSSR